MTRLIAPGGVLAAGQVSTMRTRSLFLLCLLALASCTSPVGEVTSTPAVPTLPGIPSANPSPTFAPTPTPFLALTQALLPSATPVTYTVVLNDTLFAIAGRFGVTVDAIMAANPGVNPNALIVGTVLVIPIGAAASGDPTVTPVPLTVRQTRCYPTADGGLWCLALIENGYAETVENLSALFTLIDLSGQEVTSQVGYAPLNILPPGRAMPLGVFFPAPVPEGSVASLQVLTSVRILPGDQRYLPAVAQNTLIQVDADGLSAQVSGQLILTAPAAAAGNAWVLAVAYSADGSLVGFKRWDSLAPFTGSTPFSFSVYSLGPAITRVEFILEVRP